MSGTFGKSSDRRLIERIAKADKAAVQALFARYHLRIYRFIARMVGTNSVAVELANEVFLDVWRQAGRFEGRSAVSTWLMAMARKKAISHVRAQNQSVADGRDTGHTATSKEQASLGGQPTSAGAVLRFAIERLSPDDKAILDLAFYHEFSVREVAKILEIPAHIVKTRMYHARIRLFKHLKSEAIERSWP